MKNIFFVKLCTIIMGYSFISLSLSSVCMEEKEEPLSITQKMETSEYSTSEQKSPRTVFHISPSHHNQQMQEEAAPNENPVPMVAEQHIEEANEQTARRYRICGTSIAIAILLGSAAIAPIISTTMRPTQESSDSPTSHPFPLNITNSPTIIYKPSPHFDLNVDNTHHQNTTLAQLLKKKPYRRLFAQRKKRTLMKSPDR